MIFANAVWIELCQWPVIQRQGPLIEDDKKLAYVARQVNDLSRPRHKASEIRPDQVLSLNTTDVFLLAFGIRGLTGRVMASGIFSNVRRTDETRSRKSASNTSALITNSKSIFFGQTSMVARSASRIRRLTLFRLLARLKTLADATNPTLVGSWL